MPDQRFGFGPFVLDVHRGTLVRDGRSVAVGNKGMLLLQALLLSPGKAVDKASLMDAAWPGLAVEESNLSVQIAALRKVLGRSKDGGEWIVTVPRVGYRFVGSVSGPPPAVDVETSGAPEPAAQLRGPSIAVLPFLNLSGRSDQEFFGDAIADDIITALTRFRWFLVVARNSSFAFRGSTTDVRQIANQLGVRYVLEGSHRLFGQRVRIAAQLIDAASGSHIWAERYERNLADIFAIQDEITDSVVGAIEPELLKAESRLSAARREEDMTAWDLVRRGVWYFHKIGRETHEQARDFFRSAAKLDPQLPEAHIWLARVCAGSAFWGWGDDPQAVVQEGLAAAFAAIRLDEKDPYAHYGLAITSCAAGQPEQGRQAAERAIELSPGFALGHWVLGLAKLYSGQACEAKVSFQHGLRLNAFDPHNFVWLDFLALAHLFTGETELAIEAATKAAKLRPDWPLTLETMAICCAACGRMDEARHSLEAMQQTSAIASSGVTLLKARNPAWRDEIERLLEKVRGSTS